jgi:hypothetical protein
MGLATEIRKAVVAASKFEDGKSQYVFEYAKPSYGKKESKSNQEIRFPSAHAVWISDVLTRIISPGKQSDYTFTLGELIDSISSEMKYLMRNDRAASYVFCFDQRALMQLKKNRNMVTQASPLDVSKQPYPEGTELVPEGVRTPEGEVTRLHINRMRMSKHLYDAFVRAFIDALDKMLKENPEVLGSGKKRVYVDYRTEGSDVWYSNDTTKVTHETDTTCNAYKLGEADLKITSWIYHFRESPLMIATSDTDFMVLYYHLVERLRNESKPIPVVTWWALKDTYYDMSAWLALVEDVLGLDFSHYKAMTMLNGTDFLDRNQISRFVALKSIICAMQELKKTKSPAAYMSFHDHGWFDFLLRFVYATALKNKFKETELSPKMPPGWPAIIEHAHASMKPPATHEKLVELFEAYSNNASYWDVVRKG